MIPQHPKKPSSSPATAKIKSLWFWETKFPLFAEETLLLFSPFPVSFQEPIAVIEFSCLRRPSALSASSFNQSWIRPSW